MVVVITIRSFLGQIFNQGYQLWCKFKPDEDVFVFLNERQTGIKQLKIATKLS